MFLADIDQVCSIECFELQPGGDDNVSRTWMDVWRFPVSRECSAMTFQHLELELPVPLVQWAILVMGRSVQVN